MLAALAVYLLILNFCCRIPPPSPSARTAAHPYWRAAVSIPPVNRYGSTLNSFLLLTVPDPVVTLIHPDIAPLGTVAVICVSECTTNFAGTPLNVTLLVPLR